MAKFSFCIFAVAVLIGGIAADFMCLYLQWRKFSPPYFILSPARICWHLDKKFDRTRQKLKMCLGFEVDISKLEALHHEFCHPNSDFRQKVSRQRYCLSSKIHEWVTCFPNTYGYPDLEDKDTMRKLAFNVCQSITAEEMSKCMAEVVGGHCGREGLEVYGRIAQSLEPFFTASCSLASMALGEDDLTNETEKSEHEVVETSLTDDSDSDQYVTSADTVHSDVIWYILLGLFFGALW